MKLTRSFKSLCDASVIAFLSLLTIFVLITRSAESQTQTQSTELEIVHVRDNVYMIAGAGGNITAHLGPEGVILVDTGEAPMADRVLAAIQRITDKRIRYIINTGADADHVAGNEKMARAGLTLFPTGTGGFGVAEAVTNNGGAAILAHDNVNLRMSAPSGKQAPFPTGAWPTETFTGRGKSLYLNNDGIQVLHQPAAHSDADSIVFFRRVDVIATGDIFDLTRFPVIDIANGGTIQGEIDALNRLTETAIPAVPLVWMEGRTLIVPGHGRVADHADLVEYRDMVVIMRDRIQALVNEGMKLDQIKAANPTQGYRKRYGSDNGVWTTDAFIEAVYKTLPAKKN